MNRTEFHDFIWRYLPKGKLPEKFSLIGRPKGYKPGGAPPKREIAISLEASRRKIKRARVEWKRWVDFEEGPFTVESIDALCEDFSRPSDTVRVAGDFIPDSWIIGEDEKRYLARFDVSVYHGKGNPGNESLRKGRYAVRETLIPVLDILGITYAIAEPQLIISQVQDSMNLTRENLCAAYQFLTEKNWVPSWIDGRIDEHDDGSSRKFSVHNHYCRETTVSPAKLIKTVKAEISVGRGKLSDSHYELLAQVLDQHEFKRSKLNFSYHERHPFTFIPG